MKKIMIACVAVAMAAVAQAASINWSITAKTWTYGDGAQAATGTTVYLINAAEWSTIESAIKGGATSFTTSDTGILGVATTANNKGYIANTTATSSSLTAGTSYNYAYLVFDTRDTENVMYYASATMGKAAYDPASTDFAETQSVTFGATQYSNTGLSAGWQAVPEPTSGLLLLLGVAGLALRRKIA
jgi:hypothetical protein